VKQVPASLVQQVARYLRRNEMLAAAQRVGVAVSAGADSVVLLHILRRLRSEFACELQVLHVNHHLRGQESSADEAFVRALARELGLPLLVEHAAPPQSSIEQQARNQRRAFFQRAIGELALQRIALGHTRSDQAETVLFRLLRGAGLTGLAGMRPVTPDNLIRPLLTCSREEVRAWACNEGIPWRDDSSNLDTSFTRNRLRLETLPHLKNTYNPNLEALLAQNADLAQTEESYWAAQIDQVYPQLVKRTHFGLQFDSSELALLHLALRRRLIRQAIREVHGDLRAIEFEHVEALVRLCDNLEGHDRAIIPGVDAMRSFGRLLVSRIGSRASEERDYQVDLKIGEDCELPFHAGRIRVDLLNPAEARDICANFKKEQEDNLEICDWDGELLAAIGSESSLLVRNWRPGDVFQRVGHAADKIKALFQSGRVLLWERRHWPVVLAGEQIIWVRQFGSAEAVNASAASRELIRLTYSQT
jgi:tRNA(Ile)-lysidine synthase